MNKANYMCVDYIRMGVKIDTLKQEKLQRYVTTPL